MPCLKETLLTLFFNCPTSFHLLLLFFNFFSTLLAKLFSSLCPYEASQSANDRAYQAVSLEDLWFFTDDFLRKEDDLEADIVYDGENLLFSPKQTNATLHVPVEEGNKSFKEPPLRFTTGDPGVSNKEHKVGAKESTATLPTETDPVEDEFSTPSENGNEDDSAAMEDDTSEEEYDNKGNTNNESRKTIIPEDAEEYDDKEDAENELTRTTISEDATFITLEGKKIQSQRKTEEEIIGDIFTDGSTSKSSSEWRNSLNYRDSGTEDPFSSSSRRSCQTWESYTVHRKYDEEMMFFDRYSTQKLSEADFLRSIQVQPRSVSERIVHKLSSRNTQSLSQFHRTPSEELEIAYVAQICLAWEALNWNYKNFKRFKDSRQDTGCPGKIAQQFQQFQVLLQRFIENEPYEHGRRPEIYARTRKISPKLLQIPEFLASEDDHKKTGPSAMISSMEFLKIIEDGIRTFMNFLKADKEKHCQIFADIFKRNRRMRVDPIHLHFMKKTNAKKKKKIKDLYRARKCFRKRKLKEEEEMEILASLIDLKVVSRVLKMSSISDEQLRWCEEKMSKVKVLEGKVQRDSSPLFFPAQ